MSLELANTTTMLLREIAEPTVYREDVALTYALAIASSNDTNWARVNRAIMARWSVSGLKYIKRRAWKMIKVKAKEIERCETGRT